MSKRVHIDSTGAARSVASDRGIYTERDSELYTVQFTPDPYDTVAAGNFDIPVAPGFTNVVPGSGTIVGACKYSHDLTNCLGDMIHVNISGKVQTKRVATSENVNNGILTIPFCADVNAGDIIHLYHYSGAAKTVASAMSSGAPILYYTYVSYKEPYLVANGNGVVSDPRQGYVSINEDLTMRLNKPVNVTAEFKAAITLVAMTNIANIATVWRYGNQIIVTMAGNGTQTAAINTSNVLFTISAASPFCPFNSGMANITPTGVNGGNCITFQGDGTFQFWGNTLPVGTSIGASISYFCKGE
jgi:hypothetical protein